MSSSQRLSYQAPSGSSEVTGLRPSPPRSSAAGGMARSRIALITPGLVRIHSEGRHDGGATTSGLRIAPWPTPFAGRIGFGAPLFNSSDENLVRGHSSDGSTDVLHQALLNIPPKYIHGCSYPSRCFVLYNLTRVTPLWLTR